MFSENRCENNQNLLSILDSTKLVFNVPRLGAVAASWNDYFLAKIIFLAENRRVVKKKVAIEPNRC